MEIDELKRALNEKYLKNDEYRYEHSLGVLDISEKLAKHYKVDIDRARKAALMHDMAKEMQPQELIKYIYDNKLQVAQEELDAIVTLHGIVASDICKKEFGFDDEMCSAIANHTMGRENMSMLEKIIYIADKIDMTRNYDGVEVIRELAFFDINMAIIKSIESFIKKNIENGKVILTGSIITRNFLLRF